MTASSPAPFSVRAFLGFLVAFLLIGGAWAFATPLGGTPDEPAHLIKAAAVARGELLGDATEQPAVRSVTVPAIIGDANAWPCFAFHDEIGAACQAPFPERDGLVDATTSAGLYNPMYYALVGWPSLVLPTSESAVYGMRLVSVLLCSILLGYGLAALRTVTRPLAFGIAVLAASTPMVGFLLGALNPNGLEIAAGVALFGGLAAVVLRPGMPARAHLVAIAASGVLLSNARGISPLWMALVAAVVLLLVPWARIRELRRSWRVRLTFLVLVLGVVAAGVWILVTGTLGSLGRFPGAGTESPLRAFLVMLTRAIDPGYVGVFGWLDTPAPPAVYAVWSALLLVPVVLAVAVARGRRLAAVLVATAGVVLLPAIVQAASVRGSGYIWQGRYALVALVLLVLVCAVVLSVAGFRVDDVPRSAPVVLLAIAAGLAVLAHVAAFAFAIRRYAVGVDGPITGIVTGGWAPPGGSIPWILVLGAGATLLAVTLGADPLRRLRTVSARD
jgi:hypothetical protein